MKTFTHWLMLFLALISLNTWSVAQSSGCGTHSPKDGETKKIESQRTKSKRIQGSVQNDVVYFPINLIVLRDGAGNTNLNEDQMNAEVVLMNQHFAKNNIQFYVNKKKYVNTDAYYNKVTQENIIAFNEIEGDVDAINIYFAGEVNGYCGFARFPFWDNSNLIVMNNGCLHGGILSHEMGHTMGLLHTHETFGGVELVNGSNCSVSGDLVCDTPADPNLSNKTDNCVYTSTVVDANGDLYHPLVNNIMSYAPSNCYTQFTQGQDERARFYIDEPSRLSLLHAPEVPSNLVATVTATGISLSWQDNSMIESGFVIERTNGTIVKTFLVGKDVITFFDTDVQQGGNYEYVVKSRNYTKYSIASNQAIITGTSSCNQPAWQSSKIYVGGEFVSFNNKIYKAKWWTQNNQPGTNDVWAFIENCQATQLEPRVSIITPTEGQIFYHNPSQSIGIEVKVGVNNKDVTIDSVLYIVVDVFANSGTPTRYVQKQAPYTLNFNATLGTSRIEVNAIAFSKGKASNQDVKTIKVLEYPLPTLSILSPKNEEVFYYDEQNVRNINVSVDVNDEVTLIDSVYYTIVNVFTNHAVVKRVAGYQASAFGISFDLEKTALYTEIHAIAFDKWKRASSEVVHTIYAKRIHEATIISPKNEETIYVSPDNLFIDVLVTTTEPIDSMLYIIANNISSTSQGIWVSQAPYTLKLPVVFADYTNISAIPFKNGIGGKPGFNKVYFREKITLQATIISPQDGETVYATDNSTINVQTQFTQNVDSVLYVITDVNYLNQGITRQIWVKQAPFNLQMPIIFGNYSIIRAIPFKNGNQGIIDENTVYFKKDIYPVVAITSPLNQQKFVVNEGDMISVQVSNVGQVAFDSIQYIIVDIYDRNAQVKYYKKYNTQELSFQAAPLALSTEIHVIAFGNGGRGSQEIIHTIFVEAKPSLKITAPLNNATIPYNPSNVQSTYVTVDVKDIDGTIVGTSFKVTDGFGTFNYHNSVPPYSMQYNPRIAGDVTVRAVVWDNDGHTSDTVVYHYIVVEQSVCSLPIWNSTTAYSTNQEVQYNGISYKANWWTQGANPSTNNGAIGTGQPWTITTKCGSSTRTETEQDVVNFVVYPNPSTGIFTLVLNQENTVLVQIVNTQGAIISEKQGVMISTEFDLSNVTKGIYFVRVVENDDVKVQKIVIE